jgi:hypothetical protein
MKLKVLKNIKTDVSGSLASRFKVSRSLKDLKNNTYFKLNKIIKRRKVRKNSVFKLRSLMSRVKSINKYSRNLDFNSVNTKNVFLRTKRKSSFGQTLLEKQRLKGMLPYTNEKQVKNYFKNDGSVLDRLDYVLNVSNIFISKDFIKSKLVLRNNFFKSDDFCSFNQKDLKYSYCSLSYVLDNSSGFNAPLFDRVLPSNLLLDIRLDKIKILKDIEGYNLPFDFNIKKVIQHYRLRRG